MNIGTPRLGGKAAAVSTCLCLLAALSAGAGSQRLGDGHTLYVESNAAAGNSVLVYHQNRDGSLTAQGSVSTGGKGNGAALGQGALAFGDEGRLLYAVNAGDNTVSVFAVGDRYLDLLQVVPSNGTDPISVTAHNDIMFVLNAGGATNNITGFKWSWVRGLRQINGSTRTLSTATPSPEQVGFSSNGEALVVTEKGTNLIDTFAVNDDGNVGTIVTRPSVGGGPFGFAFGRRGTLVVSEAGTNSGSSYRLSHQTNLAVLTGAIATDQKAPCWAIATHDGAFAYFADAASNAITGWKVNNTGTLTPVTPLNGLTASTDAHPIDMAVSYDNHFLYVVSNNGGAIDEFEIKVDGSLVPISSISGLPTSISGALTR